MHKIIKPRQKELLSMQIWVREGEIGGEREGEIEGEGEGEIEGEGEGESDKDR